MYYSDAPVNIISTNSMFILNEHYDGKTTQVGGTIPFPIHSDKTFHDGRYDTYLYLKTFENDENGKYNGKNKYVKITIEPDIKVFISPYKCHMSVNNTGEITYKAVVCAISFVRVNDFLMGAYEPSGALYGLFFYDCYFSKDRGFGGYTTKFYLKELERAQIPYGNVEVVDDIDLHILYMANRNIE